MANKHGKTPVEDLLEYCARPGYEPGPGLLLASVLLDHPIGDRATVAYAALVDAFEQLLWSELERLRAAQGVASMQRTDQVARRLEADLASGQEQLAGLSLVWARYIDRVEVAQLMPMIGVARSACYERLRRGVREVSVLIDRVAAQRSASGLAGNAARALPIHAEEPAVGVSRASHGPNAIADSRVAIDLPVQHELTATQAAPGSRIHAQTVFVVHEGAHVLVSERGARPAATRESVLRALRQARMVAALFTAMPIAWFALATPLVGVVLIMLGCGWRGAVYLRAALHQRRSTRAGAIVCLALAAPWLVIPGCAALLAAQQPTLAVASTIPASLRLQISVLLSGMLLPGAIDLLRWLAGWRSTQPALRPATRWARSISRKQGCLAVLSLSAMLLIVIGFVAAGVS